MREIRKSGSEGGGGGASPYPYLFAAAAPIVERATPARCTPHFNVRARRCSYFQRRRAARLGTGQGWRQQPPLRHRRHGSWVSDKGRGRCLGACHRRSATGATVHGFRVGTFACRPALGGNGRGRCLGTCRRRSPTGTTVHGFRRGTFACHPARPHRATTGTTVPPGQVPGGRLWCWQAVQWAASRFRAPRRPVPRPHQPLDHPRPLECRLPRR